MKKFSYLALVALCLIATSCLGNGNVEQKINIPLQMISLATKSDVTTSRVATNNFEFDYNTGKAKATVRVAFGSTSTTLVITDMPFTVDTEGYKVNAGQASVEDELGNKLPYNITSVQIKLQVISETQISNVQVRFTLDNAGDIYQIVMMPEFVNYYSSSTSTVIPSPGSKPFITTAAKYYLKLNTDKKTATITVENIQFVAEMPTLSDFELMSIPYTETRNGIAFNVPEIIPTSKGVPMESRKITNFVGDIDIPNGSALFTFKCMGMDVTAQCDIKIVRLFDNNSAL